MLGEKKKRRYAHTQDERSIPSSVQNNTVAIFSVNSNKTMRQLSLRKSQGNAKKQTNKKKTKTAFTSVQQALKTREKCETEELPEACVQALMSVQKPGVSGCPCFRCCPVGVLVSPRPPPHHSRRCLSGTRPRRGSCRCCLEWA